MQLPVYRRNTLCLADDENHRSLRGMLVYKAMSREGFFRGSQLCGGRFQILAHCSSIATADVEYNLVPKLHKLTSPRYLNDMSSSPRCANGELDAVTYAIRQMRRAGTKTEPLA